MVAASWRSVTSWWPRGARGVPRAPPTSLLPTTRSFVPWNLCSVWHDGNSGWGYGGSGVARWCELPSLARWRVNSRRLTGTWPPSSRRRVLALPRWARARRVEPCKLLSRSLPLRHEVLCRCSQVEIPLAAPVPPKLRGASTAISQQARQLLEVASDPNAWWVAQVSNAVVTFQRLGCLESLVMFY